MFTIKKYLKEKWFFLLIYHKTCGNDERQNAASLKGNVKQSQQKTISGGWHHSWKTFLENSSFSDTNELVRAGNHKKWVLLSFNETVS
jgi:hypothetical protein